MKIVKCDLCDATAEGETFEAWKQALMPHYMEAHADVMNNKAGLSDEEKQRAMQTWMTENAERFAAA